MDDYLAAELQSPVKHEYLAGIVYAREGSTNAHNTIAGNVLATAHAQLRGKPCRPCNSDSKVRLRQAPHLRFYYPDVSIICRPNSPSDSFQDEPAALFEVLSRSTRRIDEGEKKDAYLAIPSLQAYVLIEQDVPTVVVYRRHAAGFDREVYTGLDAIIPLTEVGIELRLADVYERIEFWPQPAHEE